MKKKKKKKKTQKFKINTATTIWNPTLIHIFMLCIFGQLCPQIQWLWPTKTLKPKKYLAIWNPNQQQTQPTIIDQTNQPILQSEIHINRSDHQSLQQTTISPSSHHNPRQQQTHPTIHPHPPPNQPPLHNYWSRREL